MKQEIQKKGEVILYHPSEKIKLEVRLEDESVWLTQAQMAELFSTTKQNVSIHIGNIFREGELLKDVVVKDSFTTTQHGAIVGKIQTTKVVLYNLDVIISVGYRVKSQIGTRFRQWANGILKDYLLKGYAIHQRIINLEDRIDRQLSVHEKQIKVLQEQIDLYIKTNEEPKEMLFGNGCVFDAWNYMSDLVRSARREIVLIDNYVDDTVLAILSKREKGVKATVHSRYRAKLIADLEKYNKQFPDAEIDFIQFSDKNHDRFLIIDDDVYMLGNSVKDFGNAWGAVIRMEMSKGDILAMVERR